MSDSITLHSTEASAVASCGVDFKTIVCKWKQTEKQAAKIRAFNVPRLNLVAPEVPESFRALVESAILSAAHDVVKAHVNLNGELCYSIPAFELDRSALVEFATSRGDADWVSADDLVAWLKDSATWKRITNREEFKLNPAFRKVAEGFFDNLAKLSGKKARLNPELANTMITKIEESDMNSEVGIFVLRRLSELSKREVVEIDLSAL